LPAFSSGVKEKLMPAQQEVLRIRGARTHNLQGLNLDLPRGRLTVFTGVSGSGKSSLAFDTIYAEGRRRYLETLPGDARSLFEQVERPDVDLIEGLPPTLCVSQHTTAARPRSTLATVTEIHDHLRLLFARLGTPHCPNCDLPVRKHTLAEIVRATLNHEEGRKLYVLAPLVRNLPGKHAEIFQHIRQGGFLRARVDGVLLEIRDTPKLDAKAPHTIEMVVDRLVLRATIADRLHESLQTAVKHGAGRVILTDIDTGEWRDFPYSNRLECPRCGALVADPEPRRLYFNNPEGACPRCAGMGKIAVSDAASVAAVDDEDDVGSVAYEACPECHGARLNREARAVRFEGRGLHEVSALSVDDAAGWFAGLLATDRGGRVRQALVTEIAQRLSFLQQVGLGYLTLDRPGPTLSGGEAQRARLATHLGGGLLGVCYVLDEPTMGLHPRDTGRLIAALRRLQERGNTVLVVEHDESVIRQADYLVDIGPGAGKDGGRLLAAGTLAEVLANPASVTAPYLRGDRGPMVCDAASGGAADWLSVRGARHHNLQNIDVAFPLGRWTCLTGVSGSGKSSLARDVLLYAVRRHLGLLAPTPGAHDAIAGLEHLDKVIEVDQKPLGRSSRSTPATYTGLFDEVRKVFATARLAKIRGYKANRFSFNVRGGRCEECQGQGSLRVALQFLPDLSVPCPSCQGRRFNRATLEVLYRGRSIADVLAMPIAEAADFFANVPGIRRGVQTLRDVGLGYMLLGQPASTLSGGEAQRVKLAAELAKPHTGRTLYLLDEPTTGLHFADVANLVRVLRQLVAAGNTLVVIEHHPDLIAAADWIIDLGPGGGPAGGQLLAAGTPQQVAADPQSVIGPFLSRAIS
jgi:excinuclease ABC subunit A